MERRKWGRQRKGENEGDGKLMSLAPIPLPKSVLPVVSFIAILLLILTVFCYMTALKIRILFALFVSVSLASGIYSAETQ